MRLLGNILLFVFVVGTLYALRADIAPLFKNIGSKLTGITEQVLPELPTSELFSEKKDTSSSKPEKIPDTLKEKDLVPVTEEPAAPKPIEKPKPSTNTPGPLQVPISETSDSNGSITVSNVIAATDIERIKAGLPALRARAELNSSALAKVNDMFSKQYFDHVSPNGTTLDTVISREGYQFITVGENLAYGNFASAKEVVDAWMRSPGHRANILNKEFTEIGIEARLGMYQGREVWMLTQHFGLPASVCPSIDQKLKLEVQTLTGNLDALNSTITAKKQKIDSTSQYTYEYEQMVKEYNQLVQEYNALVSDVKIKINEYNVMVSAYNECIKSHTGQ